MTELDQSGLESVLKLFSLTVTDLWMIGVVTIVFAVYAVVSARVLFGPLLKTFEAREALTTGAESEARNLQREARLLLEQVETDLNEARVDAVKEKLLKLREAQKRGSEVILDAENEAQAVVIEGRKEVANEIEQLRSELFSRVDELASQVSESVSESLSRSSAQS